ncbi:MAG: cytochrome-c oxidase, cbb3-type subunit III [Gammaproteobacteria bacterium]|nr:cytochrome-c oxidase, cbb3-type subunit III [Gammaproteobacteria bacterium]
MTAGWTLFVAILVAINIGGSVWLMWVTASRRPGEESATTGHVWDGDLVELNSPLPRWWLWLFVGSIVFALGYLVLYPGLGGWPGTLGWSQQQQWQQQVAAVEKATAPLFERFAAMSVAQLRADEDAGRIARNLFANHCAMCHGSDARGAVGFPNLTDGDWQWGGSEDAVYTTIAQGRTGVMPAWGEALGPQGVEEVVAYVRSLSGQAVPAAAAQAGAERYQVYCLACHGAGGTGQQALGAPNLTDDVWVYGSDAAALRATVSRGRNNQMPAHLGLLGEQRVRLLAAHVLNLAPAAADAAD